MSIGQLRVYGYGYACLVLVGLSRRGLSLFALAPDRIGNVWLGLGSWGIMSIHLMILSIHGSMIWGTDGRVVRVEEDLLPTPRPPPIPSSLTYLSLRGGLEKAGTEIGRVEGRSWRPGRDQGDLLGPAPTGGMEANGTGLGGKADDGDDDLAPHRGPHVVKRGGWRRPGGGLGLETGGGLVPRVIYVQARQDKARQGKAVRRRSRLGRPWVGWRYHSSRQQSDACGGEVPHLRG